MPQQDGSQRARPLAQALALAQVWSQTAGPGEALALALVLELALARGAALRPQARAPQRPLALAVELAMA
ncbi:MAG: hypothetical protein KAF27_05180 [Porphyrobacter sp.]|nr:hypothetical protein [Porphyrobacter sp.]